MKRIPVFTIFVLLMAACTSVGTPTPVASEAPIQAATPVAVSTQSTPHNGQVFVRCSYALTDAAAINAAIQSSGGGDEIIISGQCLINQSIILLPDRSYRGTSTSGTMLTQADGANLPAMLISDEYIANVEWTGGPVSISRMRLHGNSAMNTGAKTTGIILRSWFSVVEYMYIEDMSQDGIHVAYESQNGTDAKTGEVNGRISGNIIDHAGRHGVLVDFRVTDWNLVDNWIGYSGQDGLHLDDASGWVIERNHIYGVPHNAIYADHLFGTSISDNLIEGFGETEEEGEWYGIYATVQGGAASTIVGNRVLNLVFQIPRNPASEYRFIGLVFHGDSAISVTGNALRGMGTGNETGLYYTSMGNDRGIATSGQNLIEDIQTPRVVLNGVTVVDGY